MILDSYTVYIYISWIYIIFNIYFYIQPSNYYPFIIYKKSLI